MSKQPSFSRMVHGEPCETNISRLVDPDQRKDLQKVTELTVLYSRDQETPPTQETRDEIHD
jgi:hypothetical protein